MGNVILDWNDVIDEKVIEQCESKGACSAGLRWARSGKTYSDLRKHSDYLNWMAIHCPVAAVLELLAKDSNYSVRSGVAQNSNAPAAVLELLAKDSNDDVRYGVARNSNAPAAVLELLAKDSNDDVRYWVARNSNAPAAVLELLAKDSNYSVRSGVAQNSNYRGQA